MFARLQRRLHRGCLRLPEDRAGVGEQLPGTNGACWDQVTDSLSAAAAAASSQLFQQFQKEEGYLTHGRIWENYDKPS